MGRPEEPQGGREGADTGWGTNVAFRTIRSDPKPAPTQSPNKAKQTKSLSFSLTTRVLSLFVFCCFFRLFYFLRIFLLFLVNFFPRLLCFLFSHTRGPRDLKKRVLLYKQKLLRHDNVFGSRMGTHSRFWCGEREANTRT